MLVWLDNESLLTLAPFLPFLVHSFALVSEPAVESKFFAFSARRHDSTSSRQVISKV